MNINNIWIVVFITLLSCEPEPEELFEIYQIPEGSHYTTNRRTESLQTSALVFESKFNESAIYTFDDAGFQDSKNKLLGFSDCNSLHHENSARFAWQWYHDRLEIYAYCYSNGNRIEEFMGVAQLHEWAQYRIELTGDQYLFSFKGKQVAVNRGADCTIGVYLMLWPYFGGTLPAPHDIQIRIKRI
jgi:hypothetical protein